MLFIYPYFLISFPLLSNVNDGLSLDISIFLINPLFTSFIAVSEIFVTVAGIYSLLTFLPTRLEYIACSLIVSTPSGIITVMIQ